jgi:hypothetical protein
MKFTIKPRPKGKGFDLESEALSHGRLRYAKVDDAVGYAIHRAGSARATIELCDGTGAVLATIKHDPRESERGGRLGAI